MGAPKDLEVNPFPDHFGHFWAHDGHFGFLGVIIEENLNQNT